MSIPLHHEGPSAAELQSKVGVSPRRDAKAAKNACRHFERREKSFLDPSHSLGMTRLGVSLCGFAPWREKFPNPSASASRSFAQARQILNYSSMKSARFLL